MTEQEVKIKMLEMAAQLTVRGGGELPDKRAARLKEIYRQLVALYNEKL